MIRKFTAAATAALMIATPALAGSMDKDIVDTAAAAGSFNTLLAAATAAGLVDTLSHQVQRVGVYEERREESVHLAPPHLVWAPAHHAWAQHKTVGRAMGDSLASCAPGR